MFYPVESLKRGGRFYLCWVADSWPLHFETIPQRQLWSQDVRKICDDLLEVITNESGRPARRFSLRLSSQLLHGLVRLYQRKVKGLLGDLHMINASVLKRANKKYNVLGDETEEVRRHPKPLQTIRIQTVPELLEEEQRVEDMIQNSSNVVANIQDITLKEAVIPEIQLANDGFGEENPELQLQQFQDRTLEMMLQQPDGSHMSAIDFALDKTDQSHDKSYNKSRLAHESAQMETIEEHDLTMFRKSTGMEFVAEFEKDIPEIPEIPPPELTVPQPKKGQEEAIPSPEPRVLPAPEITRQQEPIEIELEELEVQPQSKRRRLKNKLIIDKKTKLTANFIRARIDNPLVELRCEDSSDDIIFVRVPPAVYFGRPSHAGPLSVSNLGYDITRMFSRNLGPVAATPRAERDMETAMQRPRGISRLTLEKIDEEQELLQQVPQIQPMEVELSEVTKELQGDITNRALDLNEPQQEPLQMDLSEMLTQKVETLSQQRKRLAEQETVESPKRQRSGYISFRESQQRAKQSNIQESDIIVERAQIEADLDGNKENIPCNIQVSPQKSSKPTENAEMIVSAMLQESGLADILAAEPVEVEQCHMSQARATKRKTRSESTETPLGSLDRTRVSLGDSDQTTDSKRFIRDQWGTEGTMIKILKFIKAGLLPVTIRSLIAKGPIIPGHKRIIAARCFNSILKLKQHGFINIAKDHNMLEIRDITLGPKLTTSSEPY